MEIKDKKFFRKHRNKFSTIGNSILKYLEISIVFSVMIAALSYSDNNKFIEQIVIVTISLMFSLIVFVDIDKFFEESNINNVLHQIGATFFIFIILFLFVDFLSGIITEFNLFY